MAISDKYIAELFNIRRANPAAWGYGMTGADINMVAGLNFFITCAEDDMTVDFHNHTPHMFLQYGQMLIDAGYIVHVPSDIPDCCIYRATEELRALVTLIKV